jgi:hypothetical protein
MSRKKWGRVYFIRIGFVTLIFALVLSVSMNYLSDMTYACEVRDNGYGLQVKYEKSQEHKGKLFNIDNMAPGEKYTEVITVKNVGKESFKSLITAVNTSKQGNLLYHSLDFSIREGSSNGTILFNGKLKDVKDINLGSLSTKKNKTYYLTLDLPADSGDEYQKKKAGFKFVITASANKTVNGGKYFNNGYYKPIKKH